MKKVIFVIIIALLITVPAFAITRGGRSIPSTTVTQTGGVSVTSLQKTLGEATIDNPGSGVAVALSSTSRACNEATICAASANKDIVFVGGATVSQDLGIPLMATGVSADRCVSFKVDNVNLLYGASRATSDAVAVTYVDFV